MTGHTVSLNADGVTEESIEFTSSVAPEPFVPTAAVGSDGWSDFHSNSNDGALIFMVFFLGKDVTVKLSTESNRGVGVTPAGRSFSSNSCTQALLQLLIIPAAAGSETEAFQSINSL